MQNIIFYRIISYVLVILYHKFYWYYMYWLGKFTYVHVVYCIISKLSGIHTSDFHFPDLDICSLRGQTQYFRISRLSFVIGESSYFTILKPHFRFQKKTEFSSSVINIFSVFWKPNWTSTLPPSFRALCSFYSWVLGCRRRRRHLYARLAPGLVLLYILLLWKICFFFFLFFFFFHFFPWWENIFPPPPPLFFFLFSIIQLVDVCQCNLCCYFTCLFITPSFYLFVKRKTKALPKRCKPTSHVLFSFVRNTTAILPTENSPWASINNQRKIKLSIIEIHHQFSDEGNNPLGGGVKQGLSGAEGSSGTDPKSTVCWLEKYPSLD